MIFFLFFLGIFGWPMNLLRGQKSHIKPLCKIFHKRKNFFNQKSQHHDLCFSLLKNYKRALKKITKQLFTLHRENKELRRKIKKNVALTLKKCKSQTRACVGSFFGDIRHQVEQIRHDFYGNSNLGTPGVYSLVKSIQETYGHDLSNVLPSNIRTTFVTSEASNNIVYKTIADSTPVSLIADVSKMVTTTGTGRIIPEVSNLVSTTGDTKNLGSTDLKNLAHWSSKTVLTVISGGTGGTINTPQFVWFDDISNPKALKYNANMPTNNTITISASLKYSLVSTRNGSNIVNNLVQENSNGPKQIVISVS